MEVVDKQRGGVFFYMAIVERVKHLCRTLCQLHFMLKEKLCCLLPQVGLQVCCFHVEEQLILNLRFQSLLWNLPFATMTKKMNLLIF